MKRTLQILNTWEREGVIGRYAIGGAMGATFYVEPLLTFDLDVFVALPKCEGELLSLAPIYAAARAHGFFEEGECIVIESIPVQFLPAYNALVKEALSEAKENLYDGVPTRVVRVEHLIAICVQTGRAKDRDRVRVFHEQATVDRVYLADVLERHALVSKWNEWTT